MKTKTYKKQVTDIAFYSNDFESVAAWHNLLEAAGIEEADFDNIKEIRFDLDPDSCVFIRQS